MNVENSPAPAEKSPRAFTQGVGLLFQWVGVLFFVTMMAICCGSSLLSKDTATHSDLTKLTVGSYTAQQAVTLSVTLGVFFGMAMAGLGLGLQAESKRAPYGAAILTAIAMSFWMGQMFFFATVGLKLLSACCALLCILFGACVGFSIGAINNMRRHPPVPGFETLPKDYKVPYSHMHQDPPDVRYAAELEARRKKLEIQQAELEALEQKIKRRMKPSED